MRRRHVLSVLVILVAASASLSADRVRLRSGKVIEGTLDGADAKTVRLRLANGMRADFPVGDVAAVEFSPRTPPPPPPPPPDPVAKPAPITVPAGTAINVHLTEAIDVDTSKLGQTYKSIVDDPVMLDGAVVIPRGAVAVLQAVNVQQSGTMKGSDKISLKANSIAFGGRTYEVATDYVTSQGKGEGRRTARKVGGGAGLGAIVGGIAGGGEGAAIGAAIGGVTGAAVAAGGQEHLKLEAETRLTFKLSAAVKVQP